MSENTLVTRKNVKLRSRTTLKTDKRKDSSSKKIRNRDERQFVNRACPQRAEVVLLLVELDCNENHSSNRLTPVLVAPT